MTNPIHEVREARRRPGRMRAVAMLLAGITMATVMSRTGTTTTTYTTVTSSKPVAETKTGCTCGQSSHSGSAGGSMGHGAVGGGTILVP